MTKVKKKTKKQKLYKVTGYVRIEVKTLVKAKDEDDALRLVADREVFICIHGTEDDDAEEDWVFVDCSDMVKPDLAEEA